MEGDFGSAFGGAKAGGRQDPLVFLKKPIVMIRIAALVSQAGGGGREREGGRTGRLSPSVSCFFLPPLALQLSGAPANGDCCCLHHMTSLTGLKGKKKKLGEMLFVLTD